MPFAQKLSIPKYLFRRKSPHEWGGCGMPEMASMEKYGLSAAPGGPFRHAVPVPFRPRCLGGTGILPVIFLCLSP